MEILEVNMYLCAAIEALQNDPEYCHWFDELVKNRLKAQSHKYNTDTLEAVLYELEALKIGYILDHREEIEADFYDGLE